MEFLIGRSLPNNVTNLLLDPVAGRLVEQKHIDLPAVLEQEPDGGLGNGGLGRRTARSRRSRRPAGSRSGLWVR
jgi:starch phosphorylase